MKYSESYSIFCIVYIDGILILSSEDVQHVHKVLQKLLENHLITKLLYSSSATSIIENGPAKIGVSKIMAPDPDHEGVKQVYRVY